jgi:serine protease Do
MNPIRRGTGWILAGVAGICLGAGAMSWSQPKATLSHAPLKTPNDLSLAFREAAHAVLPAVVSIRSKTKGGLQTAANDDFSSESEGMNGDDTNELFRRFFGEQFNGRGMPHGGGRRYIPPQMGTGSGFIIDAAGVVLTNSHVVAMADEVTVELQDGRQFRAKSWSTDPRRDVAIVKIEAENLPTVAMGDSDSAEIGDWVLALGNPFNVGMSVTAGIISATGRSTHINEVESYIQTDAAVNPGNSGGPLINLRGEVVGINTAISTNSGGYDGVSFAIPINMVKGIADQLIKTGKVARSYLGVGLKPLNQDLRTYYHANDGGALVSMVKPNSPASEAGVKVQDVIVELNGKKITNSESLTTMVESLPAGTATNMVVLRKGERTELKVTPAEMPEDYTDALKRVHVSKGAAEEESAKSPLGLQIMALTPELAEQVSAPEGTTGVIIKGVDVGGPAFESGLRRGDVITDVNDTAVGSIKDFEAAIKGADLKVGVMLHIVRRDQADLVLLKTEE